MTQNFYLPEILYYALFQKNEKAIDFLWKELRTYTSNVCKRYQLATADIEEVLSDTVQVVLNNIQTGLFVFEGVSPISYAHTIVNRIAYKYHEKAFRNASADIEKAEDDLPKDIVGILEDWGSRMILAFLMKQLTQRERATLLLQMQGFSDHEIVEMGYMHFKNTNVVKSTRKRAKAKLLLWKDYVKADYLTQ